MLEWLSKGYFDGKANNINLLTFDYDAGLHILNNTHHHNTIVVTKKTKGVCILISYLQNDKEAVMSATALLRVNNISSFYNVRKEYPEHYKSVLELRLLSKRVI